MLQRWQTIWMLLAVLSAVSLFLFVVRLYNQGMIGIFTIVLVLLGFISIFSYRKRRIQILLNVLGIVINALLIGILLFYLLNLSGGSYIPKKGIGLLAFPVVSVLGLLIANYLIKRDEELVKSVDRFR